MDPRAHRGIWRKSQVCNVNGILCWSCFSAFPLFFTVQCGIVP
nr:unnamed protein product [Callosobruchus chinensis]